jgi:hypothetical protein
MVTPVIAPLHRVLFLQTFCGRPSACCVRRLPVVSNFLTSFWIQHFNSARLSQNSVRNAVWHALNEAFCQYLRKRNTLFDCIHLNSRGFRLTIAEMRECGTGKCNHWTSPIYRGVVHAVFHRCRYVYINFQIII